MKIEIDISKQAIAYLLCSAFEGGIYYWAKYSSSKSIVPPKIDYESFADDYILRKDVYPYIHYPLSDGGKLCVIEYYDDFETDHMFGLEEIQNGLKVFAEKAPRHFGDFISENFDATTGDVFLQCCLFGEIKYG